MAVVISKLCWKEKYGDLRRYESVRVYVSIVEVRDLRLSQKRAGTDQFSLTRVAADIFQTIHSSRGYYSGDWEFSFLFHICATYLQPRPCLQRQNSRKTSISYSG